MSEGEEEEAEIASECPQLGVRLSYFEEFIHLITPSDKTQLKHKSIESIYQEFIQPITITKQCSYCEHLQKTEHYHSFVGTATIFISYSWKSEFLSVIETLQEHFQSTPSSSSSSSSDANPIIWMDLFSISPSISSHLSVGWLSRSLKGVIKRCHHTVLVLSQWKDPIPLTRTWCLFELYYTLITKGKLEIALCKEEETDLLNELSKEGALETIHQLVFLNHIDCATSETTIPIEKQLILTLIEEEIGFQGVNNLIMQQLRRWLLTRILLPSSDQRNSITKQSYSVERLAVIATLYQAQGNISKTENWFFEGLLKSKELHGEDHLLTIELMEKLGLFYDSIGKQKEAEQFLKPCLNKRKKILGKEHPLTIFSMNNLAMLSFHQQRYELAEAYYQECVMLAKKVLGIESKDTLLYMFNLATLYAKTKKDRKAEELHRFVLPLREKTLGKHHLETLDTMRELGWIYIQQQKYEEGEKLLLSCKEGLLLTVGPYDPTTMMTLQCLYHSYCQQQQWQKACTILLEIIKYRKKIESLSIDCTTVNEGNQDYQKETINYISIIGDLSMKYDDYEHARDYYFTACELYASLMNNQVDEYLLKLFYNLAIAYEKNGEYEEAEAYYLLRIRKSGQVFPEKRSDTVGKEAIKQLMRMYDHLEEYVKAEAICAKYYLPYSMENETDGRSLQSLCQQQLDKAGLTECCAIACLLAREEVAANMNSNTSSTSSITTILSSSSSSSSLPTLSAITLQIEALLLTAYQGRKKLYGEGHSIVMYTLNLIATHYYKTCQYSKFNEYAILASQQCNVHLQKDHQETLKAKHNYACSLIDINCNSYSTNNYAIAEEMFIECLQVKKKRLGYGHLETYASMMMLASTFKKLEQYIELNYLLVEFIVELKKQQQEQREQQLQQHDGRGSIMIGNEANGMIKTLFEMRQSTLANTTILRHSTLYNNHLLRLENYQMIVPTYTGWLKKKGQLFPVIRQRFFILEEGVAYYYEDDVINPQKISSFSAKPLGTIVIYNYYVEKKPVRGDGSIEIVLSPGNRSSGTRICHIFCNDQATANYWEKAFIEHSQYHS